MGIQYDPMLSITTSVTEYGKDGPALLQPLLEIYLDDAGREPAFGTIFGERESPIDILSIEWQIWQLSSVVAALKQQPAFEMLASEISPIPDMVREQLNRVLADPSFEHLPDGRIQWNRGKDLLKTPGVSAKPILDGNLSKWQSGPIYGLTRAAQIQDGEKLWKGPGQFSARVALRWDEDNLYIGVDVTDPELY
jgi:hypothetical protein